MDDTLPANQQSLTLIVNNQPVDKPLFWEDKLVAFLPINNFYTLDIAEIRSVDTLKARIIEELVVCGFTHYSFVSVNKLCYRTLLTNTEAPIGENHLRIIQDFLASRPPEEVASLEKLYILIASENGPDNYALSSCIAQTSKHYCSTSLDTNPPEVSTSFNQRTIWNLTELIAALFRLIETQSDPTC